MKTCSTCIFWLKLGYCTTGRNVIYDTRAVSIPPGDEGQCRALPPTGDNRWPISMGGHWCGMHLSPPTAPAATTLTEDNTPAAAAVGETRELPAPDDAESKDEAPAEGSKANPPVEPVPAVKPHGPVSLLTRLTGRGHGRGR